VDIFFIFQINLRKTFFSVMKTNWLM